MLAWDRDRVSRRTGMRTSLIRNTDAASDGFRAESGRLETGGGMPYADAASMRLPTTGLCLLMTTSCGRSPSVPTTPLNSELSLAPKQTMHIDGTSMAVRFNHVT